MRSARRVIPQPLIDFILERGIYLKPGGDTLQPAIVARKYADRATALGVPLSGRSVCVVGFGGGYGVGIHLLELGAARVVLQDPFAPERKMRNQAIPEALRHTYLSRQGAPKDERLQVVREHLKPYAERAPESIDIIVSSSVLEHVDHVAGLAGACRRLTRPGGINIHFIDLRDHYFKQPFEMLCYSEQTWRRWLNASNNLNRLRLPDYKNVFGQQFDDVSIEVTKYLRREFRQACPRIRPEFLTGMEDIDAAAIIRLEARIFRDEAS